MRSISPDRYWSNISLTLISSAGGSSAIGGMGVNCFFSIVVQRYLKNRNNLLNLQHNVRKKDMTYFEDIRELVKNVPQTLADFSLPRDIARTPTQASSNFITNKEQGDWAESLLIRAINTTSNNYIAVKYGKSDAVVAGEPGFDVFFKDFQQELDQIGKRPDLLIFRKEDYDENLGLDISRLDHKQIDSYIRKAIAGIEVRSSAFLIDHYEEAMQSRAEYYSSRAMELRNEILTEYSDDLQHQSRVKYRHLLEGLTEDSLNITDFKVLDGELLNDCFF